MEPLFKELEESKVVHMTLNNGKRVSTTRVMFFMWNRGAEIIDTLGSTVELRIGGV